MNESEIDEVRDLLTARQPTLAPYAQYLSDWRDIVNQHSDGWPYWSAGSRCAAKLMTLLGQAKDVLRGYGSAAGAGLPSESDLARALTPIKSLATRRKLPAPTLRPPTPRRGGR